VSTPIDDPLTIDLTGRSLLAVFAHPDDESISCGGVLARCATLGASVSLLCFTHGENRGGVRDMRLHDVRRRELDAAAQVLGVGDVVLLDYPDGFLPWFDATELEAHIASEVRRVRADVVITFGDDGLYWHPDHIALHERTTAAIEGLGADAPALYYVTMPPGSMRTVMEEYAVYASERQLLGVSNPDAFGVLAKPPTLVVDVGLCAVKKLAALKCHQTQVAAGVLQHVTEADAPRLLGVEHFHRAPVGSAAVSFLDAL